MGERGLISPPGWRPRFHVTGERNWINDPNGPFEHAGVHHLFFQANPLSPFWGRPSWGHVTSPDLVRWTRRPAALEPSPGADADGCWSGCARVVRGRHALYYTGVVGEDEARVESVCRAWGSDDLITWTKDAANPLVPGPPAGLGSGYHRDPFLWEDAGGWHMLIGSGTRGPDPHGLVLRYDSDDADRWRYGGVFLEGPRRHGPLDLGEHWECPQLLLDGDDAVLVVSCQTPGAAQPLLHAVAFAGTVHDGRFAGEPCGRLDSGDVFYAPALGRDGAGRRLLWGWAREKLSDERHATLATAGALSVPRIATLAGGRLKLRPAPELDQLRAQPLEEGEVAAQMELRTTVAGSGGRAGWTLRDGNACLTVLADVTAHELVVAVEDGIEAARRLAAPLPGRAEHELRVLLDGSLVEVFADDGEAAVTTRAYPPGGGWSAVDAEAEGDARPMAQAAWRLRADVIDG